MYSCPRSRAQSAATRRSIRPMPRCRYRGSVAVVLTNGASSAQIGAKRLSRSSVRTPTTSRLTKATKWTAPTRNRSACVSHRRSRSGAPPSRYIGGRALNSTSIAASRTIDERSPISATRNSASPSGITSQGSTSVERLPMQTRLPNPRSFHASSVSRTAGSSTSWMSTPRSTQCSASSVYRAR